MPKSSRRATWHFLHRRITLFVGAVILPNRHVLICSTVTCMDARIDPARAFNIPLGSAHVIRNAGASAKDAFRSLVISQQLLGTTEVLVVKHTGCGMLTFDNEAAREVVRKNKGEEAVNEVQDLDFLTFPELEKAVSDDVEWLKSKKIEEGINFSGWVYEVETGKVRKVV
jgi:carbonic anhydrase